MRLFNFDKPDKGVDLEGELKEQKEQNEQEEENFVPDETIKDEFSEQDIYDHVKKTLEETSEEESDVFGYFAMMNKIVERLDPKEKNVFLKDVGKFLPVHEAIVNDANLSDEEKDKLLRDKFQSILGGQISAYDPATRITSMSMHKKGFIKVRDKQAPEGAYRPKYVNGRALDEDELLAKQQANRKPNKKRDGQDGPNLKMPFRKKNR